MTSLDLDVPRYATPDGARLAGSPYGRALVSRWAALAAHRYAVETVSTDAGLPLLTFGGALAAVLTRAANRDELVPFRKIVGTDPVQLRVARIVPLEIYVHVENPLGGLDPAELPRIFHSGAPAGDVRHWSQLGVGGAFGERPIDTVAPAEHRWFVAGKPHGPSTQVVALRHQVSDDADALAAVAANAGALAVAPAGSDSPGVRPLGLAAHLPRYLWLALRRPVGGVLDPAAHALAEAALSGHGQRLATDLAPAFGALTAAEHAEAVEMLGEETT